MDTNDQQLELNLTSHLRPVPSYPAGGQRARRWRQRYFLERLDQIWFLPVWFWPDFWAAPHAEPDTPGTLALLPEATLAPGPDFPGPAGAVPAPVEGELAGGQWLSVQISAPGALPLVEIQGPGQLALARDITRLPLPVTTRIHTAEGALRLEGASIRLPAGLPAALAISHQPASPGNRRWRINLTLNHPTYGPFFEFQGVFRLPQPNETGLVDRLYTGRPIRQVLELL